ncbi:MAG: hypothetical protein ACFFEL_01105 [Candidatus Thorarchaeota archaeon]
MSEEDTYVRAKLTEINGAIERLTQMLNRMIDVISKITEVQENTSELTLAVNANTERLDEMMESIKNIESKAGVSVAVAPPVAGMAEKGAVSSLQSVLDTLETQVREGVIASDLAQKINESAGILESSGVPSGVIVKMQRWTRILRTYGRVDTINPTDIGKLRADIKTWSKEISKMR